MQTRCSIDLSPERMDDTAAVLASTLDSCEANAPSKDNGEGSTSDYYPDDASAPYRTPDIEQPRRERRLVEVYPEKARHVCPS